MKTLKLTFYCDPGHGWLAVEQTDIQELGIGKQISPYSYQYDTTAYLEEDCDANIFLNAANSAGWTINITESHSDYDSAIRNYYSYKVGQL